MKLLLLHSSFAVTVCFMAFSPYVGLNFVAVVCLVIIRCATMSHVATQTRRHMASAVRTIADKACTQKQATAD